jgi:hypothetical protein
MSHRPVTQGRYYILGRICHLDNRQTKRSPGAKWGASHDLKFVVNRPAGGLAHVHEVHRRFDYPGRIGNALISLNTFTDVSRVIPRIIYERLVAGHMVLAHHRRQASLEPAQ